MLMSPIIIVVESSRWRRGSNRAVVLSSAKAVQAASTVNNLAISMKVMTSLLSLRLAILFRRVGAAEGSIGRILKGALNEDIRALPF